MIEHRDIIIIADDWGRYPSTMQYLGRMLAVSNRLLWVGSPGLRRPTWSWSDMNRVWEKVRQLLKPSRPTDQHANVFPVHPLIIPFHDTALVRAFNRWNVRRTLRRRMRELAFRDCLVITFFPMLADVIADLAECTRAYVCVDDFTKFEGAFRCIAEEEQKILATVDCAFSISEELKRSRVPASGKSYDLPQGVDPQHFRPADGPLPAAVASLPRPIIGFFGILAPWIDYDLLEMVARKYPDATVLLLGRASVPEARLPRAKNIVRAGEVPYDDLPAYARAFDVGLIPFVVNELTTAANPLKMLEYLSMGIPVVSTALPEAAKFAPFVEVARSREEFVAAVGRALSDRSAEQRVARRAVAERYSWRQVAEDFSARLLAVEAEKRSVRMSAGRT
jgi:glycosyltransferase involved in cell wall biosynthesis